MSPTIAVLALQGAFIEHEQRLQSLGCTTIELRQAADLARPFDGLVLPGGESTVQAKLLHDLGMFEPLRQRIAEGLPALGTCARPHPARRPFPHPARHRAPQRLRPPTRQLPRRGSLGRRGEGDRRSRGSNLRRRREGLLEQQRHTRFRAGSPHLHSRPAHRSYRPRRRAPRHPERRTGSRAPPQPDRRRLPPRTRRRPTASTKRSSRL